MVAVERYAWGPLWARRGGLAVRTQGGGERALITTPYGVDVEDIFSPTGPISWRKK